MRNTILTTFFLLWTLLNFAQNVQIADPIVQPPLHHIYISPAGNDSNSGDSLTPLATFSAALDKLDQLTVGISGNVYTEVVLFSGTYQEIFRQPLSRYQIGSKLLNVSLRGKGQVLLNGAGLSVNVGGGMVYLLGSNISVRNLKIDQSNENGVRFGYNYNGTVINSHDVWIDSVEVSSTSGHGILMGIGALNANGSSLLIPRAKRFKITNCHVHDAVNYNTPQSQWGSAIKFWNTSHSIAAGNNVHDNSGEGIDFDFCDTVHVIDNQLHDNYANIYLDKVEYAIISGNLIYNEIKEVSGILLGIEAFTAFVSDHYLRDIYIHNNVILNTTGINIWQGIYSAIQMGYFSNIDISHNTLIGKQFANGAQVSFSYETFLGQPVNNIVFSGLRINRNIISANPDSLNNSRLMSSPLDPQPQLVTEHNLFNMQPGFGYNSATDQINSSLPMLLLPNQLDQIRPNSTLNPEFICSAPFSGFPETDFFGIMRAVSQTNVGAAELIEDLGFSQQNTENGFRVFPNPSEGMIRTGKEFESSCFEVRMISGNRIGEVCADQEGSLDLHHLTSGTYILVSCRTNEISRLILWYVSHFLLKPLFGLFKISYL